jgi:glycosyltransferase involved in cell wall biosynthesis
MNTITFSVIVPVYNAAQHLDACIQSLLDQSFRNYELLLINDGSKDNSLEICQRYAHENPNIRVFDKPNGGVSSARNMGLDNAQGQWLVFVDSDDKVTGNYLEGLHKAHKQVPQESSALTVAGCRMVDKNGNLILTRTFANHIYSKEQVPDGLISNKLIRFGAPWSKVYDRQLIEQLQLRFDPAFSIGEDLAFMLAYLKHANYLITSEYDDYLYSYDTNGLSASYSSFESEYRSLCVMRENFEAISGENCTDPAWLRHHSARSLRALSCLYRPKNKRDRKERLKAIERLATEHEKLFRQSKNFRIALLSHHRYVLFDILTTSLYFLRFSPLRHLWQASLKFRKPA